MALAYLDRCIINATSTGTGDFVQASALTGYQNMANAGAVNAGTYRYIAQSADLSQWEYGLGTWTSGTVTLARTTVIQTSGNSTTKISFSTVPIVLIGEALAEDFGPLASLTAADQTLSGGANVTAHSYTTGSITIDCGLSPLQKVTNGGAFTITAPSNDGSCMLMITNNGSASTVTFSGFSVGTNTGDALDTTNAHVFTVSIWRINSVAGYRIAAHQ